MPNDNFIDKVDLNLLKIFVIIYSEGNITKAARKLNMSQSRVSHCLNRLRGQFDDQLFTRSKKGVEPTPYAERIYTPIQQALATLRASVAADVEDLSKTGRRFNVMISEFAIEILLPPLIEQLLEKAPGIVLNVIVQSPLSPAQSLLTNTCDIFIDNGLEKTEGLDVLNIPTRAAVVVARKGHPRIEGQISREQMGAERHLAISKGQHIREKTETLLRYVGADRRVVCEVPNGLMIPPLVAATDLISILPYRFALNAAQRYPLQILPMPLEIPTPNLQIGTRSVDGGDPILIWLKAQIVQAATGAPVPEATEQMK